MTASVTSLQAFKNERAKAATNSFKQEVWHIEQEQSRAICIFVGSLVEAFKQKTGMDFMPWGRLFSAPSFDGSSVVFCFYDAIKPNLKFHVARTGENQYAIEYIEGGTLNYDSFEDVLTYIGQIYETVSKQIAANHTNTQPSPLRVVSRRP
ncbi:MAG: hypothetical protein CMH30_03535 [Micavibrio sp.]|nr:hypothetical protein [Micavibrio sp.]